MKLFRKKLPLVALSVFFATLMPLSIARAWIGGDALAYIGNAVIVKIAYGINLMIGFIAGVVFMLGGVLIEWTLNLNSHILDPDVNKFMFTAWEMFLNFANLLMILAIIVIAFATVIRYESYGIKKILWKVIVAAILINFSLVMAGVLIDAAGLITQFFINKSNLGPVNMATILAGAFNSQNFFQLANQNPESYRGALDGGFTVGAFQAIASIFFVGLFTIIAAIVLLAIASMLFMRFVHLSMRLAFLPIVIVAWIFPDTKGHWNKWWKDFMRWTMFAPVVTMMLYITIVALALNSDSTHSSFKGINDAASNGAAGTYLAGTLYFGVGAILNMALGVAFLVGSLVVANNFSITGSKTFNKWAMNINTGVGNWAKRKGRQAGTGLLRTKGAQEWAKKLEEKGAKGNWATRLVTRPIRKTGQLMNVAGVKQGQAMAKDGGARIKGWSDDEKGRRIMDLAPNQQVSAIEDLVKAKKVDKINPDILNKLLSGDGPMSLKAQMARYGKASVFENLEKLAGRNVAMVKAYNKVVADNPDVSKINAEIERIQKDVSLSDDEKKAKTREQEEKIRQVLPEEKLANVRQEAEKFFQGFKEEDYKNIPPSMLLGMRPADARKKNVSQDAVTRSSVFGDMAAMQIVKGRPGMMSSVYGKAKSSEYDNITEKFEEATRRVLDEYLEQAGKQDGVTMAQNSSLQEARKKRDAKAMINALKEVVDAVPENKKLADLFSRAKGIGEAKKKALNKRMFDYAEKEETEEGGGKEKGGEKEEAPPKDESKSEKK